MEFHTGYALEAGDFKINRPYPLCQGEIAVLEHGAHPNAEIPLALAATVGHRLVLALVRVVASASGAVAFAVRPDDGLEPLAGVVLGREHLGKFRDADALPVVFAGGFVSGLLGFHCSGLCVSSRIVWYLYALGGGEFHYCI